MRFVFRIRFLVVLMLVPVLFLNGCVKGIYVGYGSLSKSNKNKIAFNEGWPNKESIDGRCILAITGPELKKELEKYDLAVVHLWIPECSGKDCLPINLTAKNAEAKGYKLFVVAREYYSVFKIINEQKISQRVFSIDHFYYNTKSRKRLSELFIKDLIDANKYSTNICYDLYLKFSKGVFIGSGKSI